jgi:hypothetical protein
MSTITTNEPYYDPYVVYNDADTYPIYTRLRDEAPVYARRAVDPPSIGMMAPEM